jgi:hypothetical protein
MLPVGPVSGPPAGLSHRQMQGIGEQIPVVRRAARILGRLLDPRSRTTSTLLVIRLLAAFGDGATTTSTTAANPQSPKAQPIDPRANKNGSVDAERVPTTATTIGITSSTSRSRLGGCSATVVCLTFAGTWLG